HPATASGSSSRPYAPSRVQMSVLFTPAPDTSIRTSSAPGWGTGTSWRTTSASGPPKAVSTAAVICSGSSTLGSLEDDQARVGAGRWNPPSRRRSVAGEPAQTEGVAGGVGVDLEVVGAGVGGSGVEGAGAQAH